jgi:hypothetical protein
MLNFQLISSKIPKHHFIPKLLHESGRILHVVYVSFKCTFKSNKQGYSYRMLVLHITISENVVLILNTASDVTRQ